MLTCQARRVLRGLKTLTDNTDAPFFRTMADPAFTILGGQKTYNYPDYADEIESILKLLEDENLIRRGDTYHTLTQEGIHFRQRQAHRFFVYLGENWISFFALAVAVAALIFSLSPCP